jgi:hypothetical protein
LPAIVGIVLGVGLGVAWIAFGIYFCFCRRKRIENYTGDSEDGKDETEYSSESSTASEIESSSSGGPFRLDSLPAVSAVSGSNANNFAGNNSRGSSPQVVTDAETSVSPDGWRLEPVDLPPLPPRSQDLLPNEGK